MLNLRLTSLGVVCVFVGVACGPAPGDADAGSDAGGMVDAGLPDGGELDAGGEVDAGQPDAGATDAGLPDGGGTGAITVPANAWTWVDFPGSKCASGTSTGIGVNPNPAATDLIIYLEGGGACTSAMSCWGPNPTALNLAGFSAATFEIIKRKLPAFLSRTTTENPFKALNMVFVPYCTGDMHAGTREVDFQVNGATKPTYFWGEKNLAAYLERLVPTFPNVRRLYLSGASAGGFGTVLSFDQLRRAFPAARIDIIDDSGPPLVAKDGTDNSGLFAAWGVVTPPGCAPCKSHRDMLAYDRATQPQSRYGLLSYAQDKILAPDFGYTLDEYPAQLDQLMTSLASDPNAAAYLVTGIPGHVVAGDAPLLSTTLGWVKQLVTDDPAWHSVSVAQP